MLVEKILILELSPVIGVVRSDGKIGGYSGPGGVTQKKRLLQEENLSGPS